MPNSGKHAITHSSILLSGLLFGLLTISLSYIAPFMGDALAQIPLTIWGVAGAPLFGMFVLAIFFPSANAMVGQLLKQIFISF